MTEESATVVTSPNAFPSATSRRRRLMIFPERVLGRSDEKMILSPAGANARAKYHRAGLAGAVLEGDRRNHGMRGAIPNSSTSVIHRRETSATGAAIPVGR